MVCSLPVTDPLQNNQALFDRFGAVDGELRTLQRCGPELARVLTGEQDPLQLLFPGGSLAEARKLYVESPYARTYNATLAQTLKSAIAELPDGARLRILEIGAGTGGTTTHLLPVLPADQVDYTFTDISRLSSLNGRPSNSRHIPLFTGPCSTSNAIHPVRDLRPACMTS